MVENDAPKYLIMFKTTISIYDDQLYAKILSSCQAGTNKFSTKEN